MSQTGFTPILIYGSGTATNVPLAANLTSNSSGAELALNYADGKLFYKDSSGFVQVLATKGAAQNSISFGTTGLTPSTATQGAVTVAGTLITSNGGTGLSSYTAGDLPYYATGTALSKLGIGTAGQILTSSGTAPQWSNLSTALSGILTVSNGGTGQSSLATGSIGYGQGTSAHAALAIGTAGQVLTVNSGATAPQWTSASLIVGGAAGSNTQIQYNNANALGASSAFTFDGVTIVSPSHTANTATTGSANKGAFNYGTLGFSDTGIVASYQTSVNSYFQNVMQNTSAGTGASAEYIVYNDGGTASTNYASFGINSSGYTGTGSINAAGYGFFVTASTDLVLGTIGANGIHFTTNSSATDALAISSAGAVSLPGGTANGVAYLNGSKVVTTGSALTFSSGNLYNTGQIYGGTGSSNANIIASSNVANGGAGFSQFLFGNASGDSRGYLSYSHASEAILFGTSGSEQMRLTSKALMVGYTSDSGFSGSYNVGIAGSLGIGTSSPVGRLTIQGAAGTNGINQGIGLLYSNGTQYGALGLNNSTGWPQLMARASAGLTFHVNSDLLTTGEAMRLDASGNLIQSAPTTPPSLSTNGTMVFNLTSNTNLRVSVRGSDGVTRTANITLA